MIKVEINSKQVMRMLASFPKEAGRAVEIALDKTAYDIRDGIKDKMRKVFDSPTRYTLNSLKVKRTQNHNMQASVWFKAPERMEDHYLVPQVEGGVRKLKGFERALAHHKFVPGDAARMTKAGNVSTALIRKAIKDKKNRDYVRLYKGSKKGALPPGIYQRAAIKGRGFRGSKSTARTSQRGRKRGKFFSSVVGRGLKPILIIGRQRKPVVPLLPFYQVANKVYDRTFRKHFNREFERLLL